MLNDDAMLLQLADRAPDFTLPPATEDIIADEIFDKRGNPISLAVARAIHRTHPTLIFVAGNFWVFNGKIYEQIHPEIIGSNIINLIGERAHRGNIGDIQHLLGIETFHSPDFFNEPDSGIIMLQNGALDVHTRQLHPHHPKYRARYLLPVTYDRNADCPRFKECLNEWLPDDPGACDLIVEYLGYSLIPDTRQEKALFLVGEGSNGKGRYIRVLESILGKTNISGLPLQSLRSDRTFMTAGLDGKLLNICPESELSAELDEGWIKSLISGDSVEVERKGRDPFTMRPFARFVIQSNNPPHLKDKSNGIWRRLIVVRFTRTFAEDEQDRYLDAKLAAELPGILNLALDGLQRLNARGRFNLTQSMIEEREAYKRECNPLLAWKEECLTTTDAYPDSRAVWTSCEKAFQHYQEWCRENDHKMLSRRKFTQELKLLGVEQGTPKEVTGRTVRAFMGVELRYN